MIEKLKFVTITGPKGDIDRMVSKYLCKYEIHLENALEEYADTQNLSPYVQKNPYLSLLARADSYAELIDGAERIEPEEISLDDSLTLIRSVKSEMSSLDAQHEKIAAAEGGKKELLETLRPFQGISEMIPDILKMKFIDFSFGRMPKDGYDRLMKYNYEDSDSIFLECGSKDGYVYGVYFSPDKFSHKEDALYSSMHFERIFIPDSGEEGDACAALEESVARYEKELADVDDQRKAFISKNAAAILGAREKLRLLSDNFDIRKKAGVTNAHHDSFYILCGWMPREDAEDFVKRTESDGFVTVTEREGSAQGDDTPPTRLKNPGIFRPYEMYVKMYGLPNYKEMDPTVFVAISYSFIFGAMFGDVGQGLCLAIGGFLIYKLKGAALGGIIALAGVFSTLFGFLFGSFFGFEDVIPALWLRPRETMTTLTGVGSINTVMVCAVAFGMALILLSMVFHIINAVRQKDVEEILFGTNAIAGFIFYGGVAGAVVLVFSGHSIHAAALFAIVLTAAVIAMFLKEPLTKLVTKAPGRKIEGGIGMFIVQGFFEMFEVMLSYFSNSLSFVRIGAFAVSHAAMMGVVLQLAGYESGSPNWLVVVLGNLFVMGMEGLIVGIQVLRLEFYEMFSRFYKGDGRPFVDSLKKTDAAE